ncbi:HD domain-containing phosphohydrolase [Butyrivibrio sp. CB08]|uniref:HD domain-containing phosphohydrolase n=1 Tax=Butyrivibrio sp. CB08 TaxID=2364879 RepID=UPI00131429CC|nr:HD domain-containing phosphohydrolase [Butyrivibrio sp. CB08]
MGPRYESNMRALTFASIVSAILGLILVSFDISSHNYPLLFASFSTFLAGVGCGICTHVLKNRELAIKFPTLFCIFFITTYVLTAAGEGSAIMWSLFVPLGVCYFVSVKYGIYLSVYFTLLISAVLYSPLGERYTEFYNHMFITRFPIVYAGISIFTCMAMIQYHRTALFEIDHASRLSEEVERQTAVVKQQSLKIEQLSLQTIHTLANAIDAKDPYTKGHSARVSLYSEKLATSLGWDEDRIADLKYAALLHDIGKIGIPDSILNNPRMLTDIEFNIIKSHTSIGREMLKDRTIIKMADDVAGSHHERYDGKGYPDGLKGKEISEEARIVAIADAFDAMSSDRVYRRSCNRDYIRSELEKGKGKQFDPEFTDAFIMLWNSGELDEIRDTYSSREGDASETEASTALLQEVVETFVTQGSKDEIDITTGIMSRNAGEKAIARAMKQESGCLVFMDVDNLKKINDTYGHEAGDKILHIMGNTLTENSKDCMCCRLGGDEFLIFLRNTSEIEAGKRMIKIINDFEDNKKDDSRISIASISAGLVMCSPRDSYTDVYNKADKALYHVKQNGKSSFDFYNEELETTALETIDLSRLVDSIKNSGSYVGAMNVEYREFAKLYEFVTNLEQRFDYSFRLIMISLNPSDDVAYSTEELDRSMYNMEQSIRQTIRDVDVLTRFGKSQFLVIFLGADKEGVKTALDRIFRSYFKINGSGSFIPTYSAVDNMN